MIGTVVSKLLGMGYPDALTPARRDPDVRTCGRCEVAWTGGPHCWSCGADVRYQPWKGGL